MSESQNENVIICEDLEKVYKMGEVYVPALRGLSLIVKRQEFVAVRGPSGCGKTTLLQIIGGLATPTSGRVVVDGTNMGKRNDGTRTLFRQKKIGFVFQRFNLLNYLSAEDNILLALKIRGEQTPKSRSEVQEMMEMVGLKGKEKNRPLQMSQGEQQRVAIARSLICKPAILLADEPTGNLDSANTEKVLNLMRHLNEELHQTIMMITHDEDAAAVASRCIRMLDGQVIDHGC